MYDHSVHPVSQSSLKGNDPELSDETDGLWRVSPARADWIIAVCHSNLGDTLIKPKKSKEKKKFREQLQARRIARSQLAHKMWKGSTPEV